MKTRVEKLKSAYESLQATVAGDYLYRALLGFAEILDNSENIHEINTDLVDIYMVLGFKNGLTMQITGQITDIYIEKECHQTNIVRLSVEDRKVGTMPNSTFIFSLNEIVTIQSLDVVAHQRRMEAKFAEEMAKEEDRVTAAEAALAKEGIVVNPDATAKEPSTKPVVNSKAKEDQKNDTSKTV